MSEKRTTLSNWVYRIALGLMLLAALRMGQFMYDQMLPVVSQTTGAVFWTTAISLMSGTLSLLVAALAMMLRSGAVIWLLGLQFGVSVLTLIPSFVAEGDVTVLTLTSLAILTILVIGTVLFTYLIRREEIRRP